ncbi:hypothetical protein J3D55_000143 [Chryseobacterium ginsenosidimutans]|uniref:hypothetical protein n=1 Tax=Chryseobacterium ginsenosidimutans TaxID=687846 RepID=UPI0021698EE5|nr:hypothetical protein [Chryseobacterium ginsenosidimutans]MCS3867227.1 hypothetical protein [Chryseobacterium ginsenosidimutans]
MKILLLLFAMIIFSTSHAQNYSQEELLNKEIITKAFQNWHDGNGNFFDLLNDDMHWEITGFYTLFQSLYFKTAISG